MSKCPSNAYDLSVNSIETVSMNYDCNSNNPIYNNCSDGVNRTTTIVNSTTTIVNSTTLVNSATITHVDTHRTCTMEGWTLGAQLPDNLSSLITGFLTIDIFIAFTIILLAFIIYCIPGFLNIMYDIWNSRDCCRALPTTNVSVVPLPTSTAPTELNPNKNVVRWHRNVFVHKR